MQRKKTEAGQKIPDCTISSLFVSAGGSLVFCLSDYILLAETLTNNGIAPNGNRILTEQSVHEMQKKRLNEKAMREFETFGGTSKVGWYRPQYCLRLPPGVKRAGCLTISELRLK